MPGPLSQADLAAMAAAQPMPEARRQVALHEHCERGYFPAVWLDTAADLNGDRAADAAVGEGQRAAGHQTRSVPSRLH